MKFTSIKFAIPSIFRNVTIEPSLFIILVSMVSTNFLYQNLLLQKSCRPNAAAEPVVINNECNENKTAQVFQTNVNSWKHSSTMLLASLFCILASSWSDKSGRRRRPLIFVPMIGQIVSCFIGYVYSKYWRWSVVPGIILDAIIQGLSGGRLTIVYAAQLFICDITTDDERTLRLGSISLMHAIAILVGNGASGLMLKLLGLSGSFLLCSWISAVGLVCALFFVNDTSVPVKKQISFWRALNPTTARESFTIVLKKRAFNRRTIIWLLLVADVLCLFPLLGESMILYSFLSYRFKWNVDVYGYYISYKLLIIILGTIFSSVVLSQYFKIHDSLIGVLSACTSIVATVLYLLAQNNFQLYTIPILELFRGTDIIVVCSFLTKCLDINERGYATSIRCILTLLTPFSFPLYSYVYNSTIDSFPGAVFLISALIYVSIAFILGIVYYLNQQIHVKEITPVKIITTVCDQITE